uniref:Uncharacterized protein n=1 Tax=viral metagenome TaxID=1070528 RepID=A0A6C0BVR4_9ZZZZ
MPKRIIFKNASSGQKGVTVQRFVQDTSLLWDRIRIECSFDVEIHTEEVLILLTGLINNDRRKIDNTYLNDNEFAGDNKRFIKIDYERDKSKPPSKFEEFKKKNKGITKAQQYSSIRPNITQGAFFDNKNSYKVGSTFKSVCTDGAYIDVVRQYNIFISQTIKNITTLDYLDQIHVFFVALGGNGVKGMSKLESWNDLYILQPQSEPYQIQPRFFGDTENVVSSNKFWVLPPQFKKYGITYELYHDGEPERVLSSLSDISDNQSARTFTIIDNILKINDLSGVGSVENFCSYELLDGITPISGSFSQYTDINVTGGGEEHDLSYASVITCTRYEGGGSMKALHRFSFMNNIAEGLTGYYHQLDESKTTANNTGFFEEGVYKRGEDIANILSAAKGTWRWFSHIKSSKTAFDFTSDYHQLSGGEEVVSPDDGVTRYSFIDNIRGGGAKSITDTGVPNKVREFYDFTFKRISFRDTQFVNCDFSGSHFEECDFGGSTNFEACMFTNVTSKGNIWSNFNFNNNVHLQNNLKDGHKIIGGRFIGNEIDENGESFNYTRLRSYDEQTPYDRGFFTLPDVSMNFTDPLRIDEVTFRSFIEVEPYVNLTVDLSYVNLDDVSATDMSNLAQPFNIFIRESDDPGYVQLNTLGTRLNLIAPPPDHKNLSMYNPYKSILTAATFLLRKYAFYYSNAAIDDHAVRYDLFYNYQFQKNITNSKGVKLFGFNNTNANDHPAVGSWGVGISPYNTINSDDVMLQFAQNLNSTFGYTDQTGALPYYKLDVSYNKYGGSGAFSHNGVETNFKLRKGNLNYEYIDSTSTRVAEDGAGSPLRYKREVITEDLSLNDYILPDLYNKLDNEYIPGREQSDDFLEFL